MENRKRGRVAHARVYGPEVQLLFFHNNFDLLNILTIYFPNIPFLFPNVFNIFSIFFLNGFNIFIISSYWLLGIRFCFSPVLTRVCNGCTTSSTYVPPAPIHTHKRPRLTKLSDVGPTPPTTSIIGFSPPYRRPKSPHLANTIEKWTALIPPHGPYLSRNKRPQFTHASLCCFIGPGSNGSGHRPQTSPPFFFLFLSVSPSNPKFS